MVNEKAFTIEFGTKKFFFGLLAIPNHFAGLAIVVIVAFAVVLAVTVVLVVVVLAAVTVAEAAITFVAIAAELAIVRKVCVQ